MGVRQALGIVLTELVNGLFNEFKTLIKHGIQPGKTLFDEIRERFAKVIKSVIKKIPDAIAGFFEGGISGFMSNLLTFLLNSVLSTAKRFVTMIRDGLLGLWKALKTIFFPPKGMTKQQALQEGLKILGTVIITSIGFLLNETVNAFMATVPFVGSICGCTDTCADQASSPVCSPRCWPIRLIAGSTVPTKMRYSWTS